MNEVFMLYERWNGLITLVLGVYFSLFAFGYLPRNPKDPERLKDARRKFGPWMRVLAPIVIFGGIGQLAIGLSQEPTNPAARRVFNEFYRANEARSSRGASIGSAEQFLQDLKKIEITKAPDEVRSALLDYTQALEDGLGLLRAAQSTSEANSRMTDAQRRLEELDRKYRRNF